MAALYRASIQEDASVATSNDGIVQVLKSSIMGPDGGQVLSLEDAEVRMTLRAPEPVEADLFVGISLGQPSPSSSRSITVFPSGDFEVMCRLHNLPLPKGHYSVWTAMTSFGKWAETPLFPWKPVVPFDTFGPDVLDPPEGVMVASPLYVGTTWDVH